MDTGWSDLHEPHERLKWARMQAGYSTARAAADSLGMKPDTYSAYEREPGRSKHIAMDHQSAIRFGRKYKVSWEWLLLDRGTPMSGATSEAQERVLAAMAGASEEKQAEIANVVSVMVGTGTGG